MVENVGLHYIGSNWRKTVLWARNYTRGRRTSANDKGEFENCAVKEEKLYRYSEKATRV
jgi:hypothetical protein